MTQGRERKWVQGGKKERETKSCGPMGQHSLCEAGQGRQQDGEIAWDEGEGGPTQQDGKGDGEERV
jgi:hypothetical protein